jgi:DNA repair photolyase
MPENKPKATPRYLTTDPCQECGACNGSLCAPARNTPLRSYDGIRFTSDGFDCALPVTIDSHSHCAYGCLYCFSDNLVQHREAAMRPIGQTNLRAIEALFAGEPSRNGDWYRMALKYDDKRNGYPCPVQLGGINDPCDHIERQQGWLLKFIRLAIRYRQPVRISTKGTIFQLPEYLDAVAAAPELFWVAFSTISCDDAVMARVDKRAPSPTERIKTMRALSGVGVKTALRFRPMLPGISDRTAKYPHAYRTLIEMAAEAGAGAISYEVAFVPGAASADVKNRWKKLEAIAGVPFLELYRQFGPVQACMRPPYTWTEDIMHRVRDVAHECGMTVGISDPVWKQLGDTGCCCGILPDDPVFGNWQRESVTNQLLEARDTGKEIGPDDIIPPWARVVKWDTMANPGTGPLVQYKRRHDTWADNLRGKWNSLDKQRGPLNYFQGALLPVRQEGDDIFYKYQGLERKNIKAAYWRT